MPLEVGGLSIERVATVGIGMVEDKVSAWNPLSRLIGIVDKENLEFTGKGKSRRIVFEECVFVYCVLFFDLLNYILVDLWL